MRSFIERAQTVKPVVWLALSHNDHCLAETQEVLELARIPFTGTPAPIALLSLAVHATVAT